MRLVSGWIGNCQVLEVFSNLAHTCAKLLNECNSEIWNTLVLKTQTFLIEEFLSIGFSHHRLILSKTKNEDERIFYIKRCATEQFSYEALSRNIASDDYHHQGSLPNNFYKTLPAVEQAFRAVNTFKDEYLLDYINVEELGIRDKQDIDEKIVENAIIHNVKMFILTFGKDFTFVRNLYQADGCGNL